MRGDLDRTMAELSLLAASVNQLDGAFAHPDCSPHALLQTEEIRTAKVARMDRLEVTEAALRNMARR